MALCRVVEQAKGTEDIQASEDIAQPPAELKSITEGSYLSNLTSLTFLCHSVSVNFISVGQGKERMLPAQLFCTVHRNF